MQEIQVHVETSLSRAQASKQALINADKAMQTSPLETPGRKYQTFSRC